MQISQKLQFSPRALSLIGITLVIFALRLMWVHYYGGPVPRADGWRIPQFIIVPWLEGNLNYNYFFAPHNEHRVFFTRLFSLLTFLLNNNQWDVMIATVLVNSLLAAIVVTILIATVYKHVPPLHTVIFSAFLFYTPNYMSQLLLWSWQMVWYIFFFFSVAAICCVVNTKALSKKWFFGLILAFCAFFNIASPAALLALLLNELKNIAFNIARNRSIAGAIIISLLIVFCIKITPGGSFLAHKAISIEYVVSVLERAFYISRWPFIWLKGPWITGALIYFPLALFLIYYAIKRTPAPTIAKVGALLAVFVACQTLIVSVGREGMAGGGVAGRHMESMPFGILGNYLIIYSFFQGKMLRFRNKNISSLVFYVWISVISIGLIERFDRHMMHDIAGQESYQKGAMAVMKDLINGEPMALYHKFAPYPHFVAIPMGNAIEKLASHKGFSYHFYLDIPYSEIDSSVIWSLIKSGQIGALSVLSWLLMKTWWLILTSGVALIAIAQRRDRSGPVLS